MRLIQQYLVKNDCYTVGKTINVKGVMVHSTGSNNPNVSRYVPGDEKIGINKNDNHWNHTNAEWKKKYGKDLNKCVHAFVGKFADGSIGTVQTLPWNRRAWHCASGPKGSANDTHISFEICEDSLTDASYFNAVYKEAVELTAYLCKKYNLNPLADGVVICHQEGYRRGIASNHGDVLHWFPKFGKSMDDFRNDVAKAMKGEEEEMFSYEQFKEYMDRYRKELGAEKAASWAVPYIDECIAAGIMTEDKATESISRPADFATRQELATAFGLFLKEND